MRTCMHVWARASVRISYDLMSLPPRHLWWWHTYVCHRQRWCDILIWWCDIFIWWCDTYVCHRQRCRGGRGMCVHMYICVSMCVHMYMHPAPARFAWRWQRPMPTRSSHKNRLYMMMWHHIHMMSMKLEHTPWALERWQQKASLPQEHDDVTHKMMWQTESFSQE